MKGLKAWLKDSIQATYEFRYRKLEASKIQFEQKWQKENMNRFILPSFARTFHHIRFQKEPSVLKSSPLELAPLLQELP